MKAIHQWFDEYSESHKHPTNQKIHWICVPAILWGSVGFSWYLSPALTLLLMTLTLIFYTRLSLKIAISMALLYFLMLFVVSSISSLLLELCLSVFFIAWLFQFISHRIEGRKPSFFKDLQFLLIDPVWHLSYIFKWLNLKYWWMTRAARLLLSGSRF